MGTPETTTTDLELFNCETATCTNPFRVISLMTGDSTAHYHCFSCWMAWNAAVIAKMAELGMIQTEATPAANTAV